MVKDGHTQYLIEKEFFEERHIPLDANKYATKDLVLE
jgi:hypothetical protein